MELARLAFMKIVVMFIILILGIVCYKKNIVTKEGNSSLSNLLLLVVSPCILYMAFQRDYTPELMKKLAISFIFSILVNAIAVIASMVIIKKNGKDSEVERMAAVYSNCAFMGIPIISALFGQDGVFYLSSYVAIFNVMLWTHGVMTMTGRCDIKVALEAIKNPAVIAFILALISFVVGFKVPAPVAETMNFMADLNTPLAMLVAGVTIAQGSIVPALKNARVYLIAALRLIVLPLIGAVVLLLFNFDTMVTMVIIVAFACPTAASGTLFAIRYDKNAVYASQNYLISTLLSVVSLPIVIICAQKLAEIIG